MRLFIPACGYRIKLTQDWSFPLYFEHRNESLLKQFSVKPPSNGRWYGPDCHVDADYAKGLRTVTATLSAGTVLEVDRVYVRAHSKSVKDGDNDYDAVTFRVVTQDKDKKARFWAKLADVNNIEYELPPDATNVKERVAANKKAKRLTPGDIYNIMATAINQYENRCRVYDTSWYTDDVKACLLASAKEYRRRQHPHDKAFYKKAKHDSWYAVHSGFYKSRNTDTSLIWALVDMFNTQRVTSLGSEKRATRTTRDEVGRLVRRYTGHPADKTYRNLNFLCGQSELREMADASDMWLEVVSDPDDTKIVDVRCGFGATS